MSHIPDLEVKLRLSRSHSLFPVVIRRMALLVTVRGDSSGCLQALLVTLRGDSSGCLQALVAVRGDSSQGVSGLLW